MKKSIVSALGILLLISMLPYTVWAWCWIRETGTTDANCTAGSTYQQDCCSGALRKWDTASMTYEISTATNAALFSYIRTGTNRWNNVVMSDFTFVDGGTTSIANFAYDNVNLINIDSSFCTHNPGFCGQGILGFSGTLASGSGDTYRAVESDVILNDEEFTWGDGTSGTRDTVAVIAHETGHNAGLTHPGSTCRQRGSAGCGPEVPKATMYWNYSGGQPTNKASLELDDVAALVYGYPRSKFRVRVLDNTGSPVQDATVELLDSAAPKNGNSIATGGSVYGDVTDTNVLFGDKDPGATYFNASPFSNTDAEGHTNYINPVHRTFRVQASSSGVTNFMDHTVPDGDSTLSITLNLNSPDSQSPSLAITSHANNQAVIAANITLAGTANDAGSGSSGIQQVMVNGSQADNSSATGSNTANWSADVSLNPGSNTFSVIAYDNSPAHNTTTQNININYDNMAPTVQEVSPVDAATDVATNISISARFSEDIARATISPATFTVDNGVTGTISYEPSTRITTLTPDSPLNTGTTYTVTLTTGIQDVPGNAMASDYTWRFTTKEISRSSGGGGGGGCFTGSIR